MTDPQIIAQDAPQRKTPQQAAVLAALASLPPAVLTARIAAAECALAVAADRLLIAKEAHKIAWYRLVLLRYEADRRAPEGGQ